MKGEYLTIKRQARVKIPVGACRFIASVASCQEEEEARAFIEKVKEEFSDATHNAYAYKLGTGDRALRRTSDDQEPAGTAGPPLLSAIEKGGLTNVVVVGTRYFGGIKLGIGGLIRAYRACGEAGLKEAGVQKKIIYRRYLLTCPYDHVGQVMKEISGLQGEIREINYTSQVRIDLSLPPSREKGFKGRLKDITRGKGRLEEY